MPKFAHFLTCLSKWECDQHTMNALFYLVSVETRLILTLSNFTHFFLCLVHPFIVSLSRFDFRFAYWLATLISKGATHVGCKIQTKIGSRCVYPIDLFLRSVEQISFFFYPTASPFSFERLTGHLPSERKRRGEWKPSGIISKIISSILGFSVFSLKSSLVNKINTQKSAWKGSNLSAGAYDFSIYWFPVRWPRKNWGSLNASPPSDRGCWKFRIQNSSITSKENTEPASWFFSFCFRCRRTLSREWFCIVSESCFRFSCMALAARAFCSEGLFFFAETSNIWREIETSHNDREMMNRLRRAKPS